MSETKITTVTAAIIIENGSVLLGRRSQTKSLPGMWEFPGGKCEHGESLYHCLEREILEELGVQSKAVQVFNESLYAYEHGTIKLIAIFTKVLSYNFILSVHDRLEWVDIKQLFKYDLSPADLPIARKLIDKAINLENLS